MLLLLSLDGFGVSRLEMSSPEYNGTKYGTVLAVLKVHRIYIYKYICKNSIFFTEINEDNAQTLL